MKIRKNILVLTSVCGFAISALGAPLPALRVKKASVPPRLDGKLDDVCWRLAAKATDFSTPQHGPAEAQTTAYLAYDDKNLYLAFKCDEPEPAKIRAQAASEEDGFWGDDLVDFFVLPDGTSGLRYQFAVTSSGLKFDQEKGLKGRGTEDYNPSWEVATHLGQDAWSAEAVIPLEEIGVEPQIGKTWRMNFTRHRSASERPGTSSWAPVGSNWHNRDAYGTVRGFMIGGKVLAPKTVSLRDADADEPRIGNNMCRLRLKNKSPDPQAVTIAVRVHAPSGTKAVFSQDVTLDATTEKDAVIEYSLAAQEGQHKLVFELSERGAVTFISPPLHVDVPSFLDTYLDRNYYTREDTARIHVQTRLREEALRGLRLTFALKEGDREIESREFTRVTAAMAHSFSVSGLETGDYSADIRLLDDEGNLLASSTERLEKLPPSDHEVKIDKERRIILLNGKPHFVVGMYSPPLDAYAELSAAHFNCVTYMYHGGAMGRGVQAARDTIAAAAKHRLNCLFTPPNLYPDFQVGGSVRATPDAFAAAMPAFTKQISTLRNLPQLCWFSFDEPGGVTGRRECKALYRAFKQADPYIPVLITFASDVKFPVDGATDIVCIDNYYDPARSEVTHLIPRAEAASRVARREHLPFVHVPQANLWSGAKQSMTPTEQRFATYVALTKGVNGFIWFSWRNKIYLELWNEMKKLTTEIHEMAPMLLTGITRQTVNAQRDSTIHLLLKEYQGELYLITANASRQAANVTFTLPALEPSSSVEVMFEKRRVKAQANSFTDKFTGYGTHVYRMKRAGSPASYEIAVAEQKLNEHWDPVTFFGETRASYRDRTIDVRGPDNTLASIARDVDDPDVISYDPATRTAIMSGGAEDIGMVIAPGAKLIIGNKASPDLGETLKGLRGRMEVSGRVEIYNSRLVDCTKIRVRSDVGRAIVHDSEVANCASVHSPFLGKRVEGARVFDIRNVDIHDCRNYVFYLGSNVGPFIGCKIHDNPKGLGPAGDRAYIVDLKRVKLTPIVLIDCKLWDNGMAAPYDNAYGENDWIYINTTDDNIDKYTFTLGSLTYKWHLTFTAKDEAGKPLAGLNVWLDGESAHVDAKGITGEDGACKLYAAEYVKDKNGKKLVSYAVKVGKKKHEYETVRTDWSPTGNGELEYVDGEGIR